MISELLDFFGDRLRYLLKSKNVRHDLINAVFDEGNEDNFNRLIKRVDALKNFLDSDDGANLLAAYRRASNIVSIEEKKDDTSYSGNPSDKLLEADEEKELYRNISSVKSNISKLLKEGKFEEAMTAVSRLRKPVDDFFEKVTVNSEAQDLRRNRLRILSQIRELLNDIANFDLIEDK